MAKLPKRSQTQVRHITLAHCAFRSRRMSDVFPICWPEPLNPEIKAKTLDNTAA